MADLVGKTVRLPPELWEKLAKRAKADERSVNYVLIQAVKAHVGNVIPDVGKVVSSQYQHGTTVIPTPGPACARESSSQKEEEKELYTSAKPTLPSGMVKRVTARLNDKAGTSYRPSGAKLRELVQARVNDGATEDDFNTVIDKKCAEWLGTDMQRYLRPLTLFGPKFDQYLGQLSARPRQSTLIMEPEDEVPPPLEDEE